MYLLADSQPIVSLLFAGVLGVVVHGPNALVEGLGVKPRVGGSVNG